MVGLVPSPQSMIHSSALSIGDCQTAEKSMLIWLPTAVLWVLPFSVTAGGAYCTTTSEKAVVEKPS